jgi:DNA-binding LytR/AlgR family response regulator
MKTTCIIVDDEPLARSAISSLLSRFEDIEIVAECEDTFEAFNVLRQNNVDLMFLDIQMPEVSGIEFLRSLKHAPAVIFTTAHRQYAVEGFELDVVDYLLKPVSFDRLMKAMDKYYDRRQLSFTGNPVKDARPGEFITIRADRKNIRLLLDDILWIQSLKDYIQVHTLAEKYITQVPIGDVEQQLPSDKFLRIHRSYIINISKVTAFTGMDVEINRMELPIGRSYKNLVSLVLGQKLNI